MTVELPRRADVVVIGGGIAGLSALYHLAKEGVTNTVLLERRQLACGTTWHSVGSVGQVRGSRLLTLLSSATAQLLPELERETGLSTGYKRYGSIALALDAERLTEFRRTVSSAKAWGHEAAILTPAEIKERYPQVRTDDVIGGMLLPGDGRTNPVDTVQALAKACRQRGARILENVKVEEIVVEDGVVRGVRTGAGDIAAEKVLLAAGMWSREIAERIGVHIPLLAAEHFYAVTEPIPGLPRDTPMVRVPDERTYYKEDNGKLLFGCLEEVAKPWGMSGIPESFCFDSLPEDLEHFGPILETAMIRMPVLKEAGIRLFFNGPESFTPDGNFHLGETAEVRDLFVSCGFNTIGVMASGGIGRLAAQLIARGRADWDVSGVDVKRAQPFETNVGFLAERITEGLGKLYGLQCPNQSYASARGIRQSPLHVDLLARGAVMQQVGGWERPAVFAPSGTVPRLDLTYGRPSWRDWCARECAAALTGVAALDQSPLAKVLIAGPDATAAAETMLSRLPDAGRSSVRSLLLDSDGRIAAVVQVLRLARDRMLLIGAAGDERRLAALVERRIADGARAVVLDVTGAYGLIDLLGPERPAVLGDIGLRARPATDGLVPQVDLGLALGWRIEGGEHGLAVDRLLIPVEAAAHVGQRLLAAGAEPMGALALESLRLEQGLAGWGSEIDATSTPEEVGLAALVDLARGDAFRGRGAVERRRAEGGAIAVMGAYVLTDADACPHGREPISADGRIIGWTLSGTFGHARGRPVGIGYLDASELRRRLADAATIPIEIEIAGEPWSGGIGPLGVAG